jgi:hypothetical protein
MKNRKFNVRKFAEEIVSSVKEKLEQIIALTELTIKTHEINKE